MNSTQNPLTAVAANHIYDLLIQAGAPEKRRKGFVYYYTHVSSIKFRFKSKHGTALFHSNGDGFILTAQHARSYAALSKVRDLLQKFHAHLNQPAAT